MTKPRLFLICPDTLPEELALACAKAAAAAADCACISVPETMSVSGVEALQALGLAVLLRDCEPLSVHRLKADGLILSTTDKLEETRAALKTESLGFVAGVSRHAAMEAAEAGIDFVAFTQSRQYAGEPIIGWWQDVTDVPAVALDPVGPEALASLLPQNPDFIVPGEAMWESSDMATEIVSALARGSLA